MSVDFETLNMRSADLERILRQIRNQLEDEDYTPVSIIGKSGIGKTESIASLAKELNIGFKELRLSHYQESDLIGLPYVENGVTKHAPADLFPPSDDPNQGILLLDEVTSSQKSMRSAVYQLMDSSRKLGQYILPKRWIIVACGNGPSDGGDFRGIEAAFMSRGFCWRVEPNLAAWKHWALKKGIHPTVVAYLSFRPEKLHVMDPDNPYDMIACPRNWCKLSTQLLNMEKRTSDGIITDEDDLEFSAAGCVGAECGPGFAAFYKYNKDVINPQDIIDGKVDPSKMAKVTDEVLYITAQNLVHLLKKDIEEHKVKETEDNATGVDMECLIRVGNTLNWVQSLTKNGVRLDVAITIIADLAAAAGDGLTQIILSSEIDEICPNFLNWCEENKIVLNQL